MQFQYHCFHHSFFFHSKDILQLSKPDFADVFAYDNKGNDEILMSVRFQDLESGINYFRYMWIHASAVPGDAPQEVGYSLSDRAGTI